jgi:hypothetical protein
MIEMPKMQRNENSALGANVRGFCKAPKSDSWVWDVPSFRNRPVDEEVNVLENQEELMKDFEVPQSGHMLLSVMLFSIFFGCSASLASLLLGYSYVVATLTYTFGGFLGFVFVVATSLLHDKRAK